jgi:hypothetical protein
MKEQLLEVIRTVKKSYVDRDGLLDLAIATGMGIHARVSESAKEDLIEHMVKSARFEGPLNHFERWALMFLEPKDRASVYKKINFVTGAGGGSVN